MSRVQALAAALTAGFLATCAASSTSGSGGRRTSAPSVAQYTSRVDTAWTPPANLATLYTAARAGGAQSARQMTPDATLAATAQAVAERVAADPQHRSPAIRAIQALAWGSGVIDPLPAILVTRMQGNPPLTELTTGVADMARDGEFNVVGVGSAPASDGSSIVVVAMGQRRVTLTVPVARRVAAGARVHLTGTIAAGLRSPEVAITHPDGRNEHFPLGEGPEFQAQFPVPSAGAYQVEILAQGTGGDTVLANFPIYVDTDPPPAPEGDVDPTATEAPAVAEPALFQLVNQARRAAGRQPLELMPALSNVARAHSVDMATNHFVAHNSPTTGTPSERIHRASLQSGTILENLGRGYSAREIHEGLMASPGHRANVLSERVTHIGIGAAAETAAGGGLVMTEDFIEVTAAIDTRAAPATLLERVNSARTRRGAAALALRPQLSEVAQQTAEAFFRGNDPQQQVVDRANRAVSRFGLIFRRVAVLATVVSRVSDAGALEPLLDPEIGAVGIGVAQGSRRDTPPNAVFVVFVLGYPR